MLITLDPTGARPGDQASRKMAARRPLAGAGVGLASNGLGRTEDVLTQVYRPQKESAGTGGMFLIRKPQRSLPPRPEHWAKLLSDADAAIADFGRTSLCDWDDATIESVAKEAAAEVAALLSREAWQNV